MSVKWYSDVQKLEELSRLLRLLATQTANLFVSANLAGRLRISDKTVESYTRLLETIFLIKRLPAWRPGLGAREIHAPKTYLVDTGLLAHLLGADEQRIRTDDQITGKVFENFVTIEILKHSEWALTRTRQYHYRDGRDEVDLVLENRAGEVVAIEAKAAATINERDYRTLRKLRDRRQERFLAGVGMYTGAETIPLSERIWAVPVRSLWKP